MRVGVVTTSYPREPGDPAGAFVAGFARWLSEQGNDVEVVAAGPGRTEDGRIPVARITAGAQLFYGEGAPDRIERTPAVLRHAPAFAAALLSRCVAAAGRWDAVVSHWLVPCGVAAAACRRPHLAIAHSGDVHLLARPGLADALVPALLAGGAVRVAFAGAHLRDRLLAAIRLPPLRRLLAARSLASPMGVDVSAFRDLRPEGPLVTRGRPIVVFLGRLVPVKGVDVLIDAVARLPGGPQLVVAGGGPEREVLEARARVRGVAARFPGEVRGAARDALFAAADVVCVPSIDLRNGRTEGTPTVLIEALAAGAPVVASDVGGVREVARGAAWLVPPGDPASLAAAIGQVLADPKAAAARVAAGRAAAAACSWEVIGARLWGSLPPGAASKLPSRSRPPIFRDVRVTG